MKQYVIHICCFIILIGMAVPIFSLNEGDMAPLIRLRDQNEKMFDSSMILKKRPIVVSFFMVPCPPCLKEIPFLQSMKQKYNKVEFVLICPSKNMDNKVISLQEGMAFIKTIEESAKTPINIRVVYDKFLSVFKSYNIKEYPSTFIIGKDGKILHHIVGFKDENGTALDNLIKSLDEQSK